MEFFQKQLQRLKRNPAFANAFDKRRTEAEVAFQIRRSEKAKVGHKKDLAKKVGCSHLKNPQFVWGMDHEKYSLPATSQAICFGSSHHAPPLERGQIVPDSATPI